MARRLSSGLCVFQNQIDPHTDEPEDTRRRSEEVPSGHHEEHVHGRDTRLDVLLFNEA